MQATKKRYLEHNLLHSELSAIFNHHPHNSSNREGGGREVLAAAEAQHCLRLHPDVPLLGVTPEHLRLTGGRPLSGVSQRERERERESVCVCECKYSIHNLYCGTCCTLALLSNLL